MLIVVLLAGVAGSCHEPAPVEEAPRPPVEARASVDRAVATTGDVITFTVEVEHDAGITAQVPEPGAEIAGLRVIDMGRDPVEREHGRVLERRWYKLRADLVGSYILPPVSVSYVPPPGSRPKQGAGAAAGARPAAGAGAGSSASTSAAAPTKAAGTSTTEPSGGGEGSSPSGPAMATSTKAAGEPTAEHSGGGGGSSPSGPAKATSTKAAGEPTAEHSAGGEGSSPSGPAKAEATRGSATAQATSSVPEPGPDGRVTLKTSEIFLEVESVLPPGGEVGDIRDIKPLRRTRFGPPAWALAAAGGALLLAAAFGVWLWRRRRQPVVIPPAPPHEIAFAALDELRKTDFSDPEALKRYYFGISAVLRAYVEGRYGLNATDLTTEEILPRLVQLAALTPQHRALVCDFLLATDRVKFAGHVPSTGEIEQVYEQALTLVESTIPAPSPEGEPAQPALTEAAGVLR